MKRPVLALYGALDTDAALKQEDHEVRFVAVLDQGRARLVGRAGHGRLQRGQFARREIGQYREVAERYFVLADPADVFAAQDVVFGVPQRRVQIVVDPALAIGTFDAHVDEELPHALAVGYVAQQ